MGDKNLHLTHIEESILDGKKSAIDALQMVDALYKRFVLFDNNISYRYNFQYKVDGSPNIVFGIHPEIKKFCVGTKSFFNKTPKIYYSPDQISKDFSLNNALYNILSSAYRSLKPYFYTDTGLYSGDFMFNRNFIKKQYINGDECYTFQPNTILYAQHTNAHNPIIDFDFGIFLHTKYEGETIDSLKANYNNVWLSSTYKSPYNWIQSPNLIQLNFNNINWNDYHNAYTECYTYIWKMQEDILEYIKYNPILKTYIQQFINHMIKNYPETFAYKNSMACMGFVNTFVAYFKDKQNEKRSKLKTTRAKEDVDAITNRVLRNISPIELLQLFSCIQLISNLKTFFVDSVTMVGPFKPYFNSNGILTPTKAEGIIIQDHMYNTSYKMVDRLEFSKQNFLNHA